MPTHKSSEKRVRGDAKKRERNRVNMSATKTAVRNLQSKLPELKGKPEEAKKLLRAAQSKLTKAVNKGLIHKNNASRKIGRLAAMVQKAMRGEFEAMPTKSKLKAAAKQK